ncbi:hypothetical protein AFK68_20940 [Hydrocoleum sp. CS-953]|nr:hypothetical protein AFK68_20940 [Hydrocoleum sp. CS-953]
MLKLLRDKKTGFNQFLSLRKNQLKKEKKTAIRGKHINFKCEQFQFIKLLVKVGEKIIRNTS